MCIQCGLRALRQTKSTLSRPCLSVWRSSVQPQPSFFKVARRCRRRARARVRGLLVASSEVASTWRSRRLGRAMEEPQQSNDRVTAAPERVAPLARPTWVQGPAGDAPGGQAGEGAPEAAAKHAAAQLPCLDASHPRHCSMCDPAARSGVDAARQRARHAGLHTCRRAGNAVRLSHSSRVCRFADALRPLQRARRANMSWWATWAVRTVRQPAAVHFLSVRCDLRLTCKCR